jgi:hypothetical protein
MLMRGTAKHMSWKEAKYEEVLGTISNYYRDKVKEDPAGMLVLIQQELQSQCVRLGNDWTGRGVVMDTVLTATISALEIARAACLENLKNKKERRTNEMNLDTYFAENQGVGVLATSDEGGVVNTAIYSRPHVQGRDVLAFIMRDRLTHKNLQENEHANFLFLEKGQGYSGVRFFLTKIEESMNQELIASMTRRHLSPEDERFRGKKFLVRFQVNRIITLIGGEEMAID